MDRRQALTTLLSTASLGSACQPAKPKLWRGFNLQEKFTHQPDEWTNVAPEWGRRNERFRQQDFDLIAELGFNFVRLPMSYRCWATPEEPKRIIESTIGEIAEAVAWGVERGIHVCLNFHRAPGFCINESLAPEPWNLWTDEVAQEIFVTHWRYFASRFHHVPGDLLSFNLINEPNRCTAEQYAAVIEMAAGAIRDVDADRLLMIDGLFGEAILPVPALRGVTQAVHSTRGYAPFKLTHHLAPWAGTPQEPPAWPLLKEGRVEWDPQVFDQYCIQPYREWSEGGARVFVGEWGCWNQTPHAVTLRWMNDCLQAWQRVQWGWALWCFRGSFGILDSQRKDVQYETWRGHQLDRRMLELLREF